MECLKSKRNVKRCRCRKWIMLLYIKNCDDKKMGNIIYPNPKSQLLSQNLLVFLIFEATDGRTDEKLHLLYLVFCITSKHKHFFFAKLIAHNF